MDTINPAPQEGSGGKKTAIIILLVILIFILTGVLAYVLLAPKAQAPAVSPQSAVPVPAKKGPSSSAADTAGQVQPLDPALKTAVEEKKKEDEKYAGWMTYISNKYK
ncbi:MAG TPA: hypothetical protein VK255_03280, partial [Patescibacteria group bacterium]|nr:hypothetical protein [Patescibacteria group bacterium]